MSITKTKSLARLELNDCSLELKWNFPRAEIRNIAIEDKGKFRDKVGVYLHVDDEGKAHLRMTLGPEVQTLTRAMTAILCKDLDGATPQEILDLPSDFVTRIVAQNSSAFVARPPTTC